MKVAEKGKRMRWREVFSKRTVVLLVVILGLSVVVIVVGRHIYISTSPRILVEGKPVPLVLAPPLHPEQSRVNATAWWEHNPYPGELETEWQIYMDIKLVELDVNDTYCFLWAGLNPHPGQDPYGETTLEAAQTFGGCDRISEGDVIGVTFLELGSNFELRSGNRVDVVLRFYVLKEKVVEGVSFWIDHMRVGEIEFSVEVQGEIPPEYR